MSMKKPKKEKNDCINEEFSNNFNALSVKYKCRICTHMVPSLFYRVSLPPKNL